MARATCPGCKRTKTVPDGLVGKRVYCRRCDVSFPVAQPEPAATESPTANDPAAGGLPEWVLKPLPEESPPPGPTATPASQASDSGATGRPSWFNHPLWAGSVPPAPSTLKP